MSPPTSKVWSNLRRKDGKLAICKLCFREVKYSGNTSNLTKHMMTNQKNVNKKSTPTKETAARPDPVEPVPSCSRVDPTTKLENKEPDLTSPITEAFNKASAYAVGGFRHAKVTNAILYFICKDNRPFAVTEGEGFRRLMHELIPTFKIPLVKEISGEKYVTISKIIPMANCLTKHLKGFEAQTEAMKTLKKCFEAELFKRFGVSEQHSKLALSTLLDPRFRNIHFQSPAACGNAISKLRAACSLNKSSSSGTDNRQQYPLKSNPLEMWEDMKTVFPSLYKQARKYLVLMATSVPSERLFSKTGFIMNQQKNHLLPKYLDKLVFLSSLNEREWFE
ncbi:uncharacterized protein LOC111059093 [Nilaparvata lugens]|uniref:uncharacterized protein LOC111059093 n=1 Tax=Nilaparvata lugens TaxID=108931 RepID=UPI00193C9186|nr:uncharacterized protein LOC111059093 [Nilaparvata lugens]